MLAIWRPVSGCLRGGCCAATGLVCANGGTSAIRRDTANRRALQVAPASLEAGARVTGEPYFTSGNDHNRRSPKRGLLPGRIQHRDLAIVSTRRNVLKRKTQTEWHRPRSSVQPARHRERHGFEGLYIAPIERHKRDERLRAGRGALVGLKKDVQLTALAEHARHARYELLSVVHERISRLGGDLL